MPNGHTLHMGAVGPNDSAKMIIRSAVIELDLNRFPVLRDKILAFCAPITLAGVTSRTTLSPVEVEVLSGLIDRLVPLQRPLHYLQQMTVSEISAQRGAVLEEVRRTLLMLPEGSFVKNNLMVISGNIASRRIMTLQDAQHGTGYGSDLSRPLFPQPPGALPSKKPGQTDKEWMDTWLDEDDDEPHK